jgi:hypothetical protein
MNKTTLASLVLILSLLSITLVACADGERATEIKSESIGSS